MALGSSPRSSASQSTTPGSRAPQRVPMQRPSSTLNPIVVATLAGAQGAEARAVAEVHHHGPPLRRPGIDRGERRRDVLVGEPVEAVAEPGLVQLFGQRDRPARKACCGGTRCRSRPPAGAPGPARAGRESGRGCAAGARARAVRTPGAAPAPHRRRAPGPQRSPAVYHPVAHSGERPVAERAAHQGQEVRGAPALVEVRALRPVALADDRAVRPSRDEVWRARAPGPRACRARRRRARSPARGRARTSSTTSRR